MRMPRNPFPSPTPLEKSLLEELVSVARECYQRGWSWGTAGNFSLRGHDDLIWQSPSGVCKGNLRADHFVPIDLQTEKALQVSIHNASGEMPVHAGIYKVVPEARCVVHTHPPSLVRLSRGKNKLVFSNQEMAKALGLTSHTETLSISVLPNPTPTEMVHYSRKIKEGIGDIAKVVILEGHGVWAWGHSPIEALGYAEALDLLCQQVI